MHSTPARQSLPLQARDRRLDFWRGLCLIDMVLVHLVHHGLALGEPLYSILGEYTRFAAGGFIFISGLSIGRIFYPRILDEQKRRRTYIGLWRRAGYVLLVHYAASISYFLLYPLFGQREPFPNGVWGLARDVLLFREGIDLLPFYVIMLLAAPVFLEMLRRRLWWLVVAVSAGIFIWAHGNAWANAYVLLPVMPNGLVFLAPLWQLLFVAGMLGGVILPRYDRLGSRPKIVMAVVAMSSMTILSLAAYGGGIALPLTFWKVPLTLGETLRYLSLILSIMLVSDLLWRWIGESAVSGAIERMGRRSLASYVAHLWIVQLLMKVAQATPWQGPGLLVFAAAAIGLMWVGAYAMDNWARFLARRPEITWWREGFGAPTGALASIVLLLGVNAVLHRGWDGPLLADQPEALATDRTSDDLDPHSDEPETPAFPGLENEIDIPDLIPA